MGQGPEWFQALPKSKQEAIEQAGHFFQGFGAGLINAHPLLWKRENIKQWPPHSDQKPMMYLWWDKGGELMATTYSPHPSHTKHNSGLIQTYYHEDRVLDKVTDEKYYHWGFMTAGITKDVAWAIGMTVLALKS